MAASSRLGVLMKLDKNQRKPRVFKASDLCPYYNRRVYSSDNSGCFHVGSSPYKDICLHQYYPQLCAGYAGEKIGLFWNQKATKKGARAGTQHI